MTYAFKYDDVIKNTKREVAKRRKLDKEAKRLEKLPKELQVYDDYLEQEINVIDHYPQYYPMFSYWYEKQKKIPLCQYSGDFDQLKKKHGYRQAYTLVVQAICPSA